MRQVLAIGAAAALAALGAVVLGEYPLEGLTVLVGFPLFGVAVAELALAVGRRLAAPTVLVVAAVVAGGLTWALWISFGHFRNDARPSLLSWVMVGMAVVATLAWCRSGRHRGNRHPPPEPAGAAGGPEAAAGDDQGSRTSAERPNQTDEEVRP